MQILGHNGVLCLLSITGGSKTGDQPIEKINQQLVLGNQVVFGSVNANPRHFAMGVKDFTVIEKKWPGVLKQLITTRLPWDRVQRMVRADEVGNQNHTGNSMSVDNEKRRLKSESETGARGRHRSDVQRRLYSLSLHARA